MSDQIGEYFLADKVDHTIYVRGNGVTLLTITPEGQVIPKEGFVMDEAAEMFLRSCSEYVRRLESENARLREALAARQTSPGEG